MAAPAPRGARPLMLVTGADGQLGWELCRSLLPLGRVAAMAGPGAGAGQRPELDLADPGALRRTLRELQPAVIANAAAFTAVDRAEEAPAAARAVNVEGPAALAEEAARLGAFIIHFSTDYVFDGRAHRPYRESDPARPLNVYGRTKLDGERAVAQAAPRHLILRTSWLYGGRGHNFLLTMLRAAAERGPLRVVDDQVGAPTWARSVAEATAQVLAQARALGPEWLAERAGTYHVAAGGSCTWYGFAQAILAGRAAATLLRPIPSEQYPLRAARPRYTVLDCGRARQTFGLDLGPWQEQLACVLDELGGRSAPPPR